MATAKRVPSMAVWDKTMHRKMKMDRTDFESRDHKRYEEYAGQDQKSGSTRKALTD